MIKLTSYHLNYSLLQHQNSGITQITRDGAVKNVDNHQIDAVEINLKSWQAKSITEDIINHISNYYATTRQNGSQTELRRFYAAAKNAVDKGFERLEQSSKTDSSLLKSAHEQTVKELKDWYHNGGKPREKVNLTLIEIGASNIEIEIANKVETTFADHVSQGVNEKI